MTDFEKECALAELASWWYSHSHYMQNTYEMDSRRFERAGLLEKADYVPHTRFEDMLYHIESMRLP